MLKTEIKPAFILGQKVFYRSIWGIAYGTIEQRNFDLDEQSWHYTIAGEIYPEFLIAIATPNLVELAELPKNVLEFRYSNLEDV